MITPGHFAGQLRDELPVLGEPGKASCRESERAGWDMRQDTKLKTITAVQADMESAACGDG